MGRPSWWLPSFNDFSPGIIKDVQRKLKILDQLAHDTAAVITEWDRVFFNSAGNKRASTNTPATLTSLGLMTRTPLALTDAGKTILSCPLLSGPSTMTVWIEEGTTNACQEAQA